MAMGEPPPPQPALQRARPHDRSPPNAGPRMAPCASSSYSRRVSVCPEGYRGCGTIRMYGLGSTQLPNSSFA